MPTDHRAKLATIKRFDQLIAYLRDEMGWPIARDSFEDVDDLFYDFTADELGIDPKTAAKIQEIKRLRPLSPKQPWGIFFVKFEPRKLPVVALRRMLSQVAVKKRASANSAERAAWAADDLLFVSNYGEGEERQISFAHFSRAQDGHDLPTLKVLGWDNRDTALHLDAVARELSEHLGWPDDDLDAEAWRTRWRAAFTLRHREVVTSAKELSIQLAELARNIRDRITTALAIETDKGPLTKLMKAFQGALVHDLEADGFADMYAQTIAYGLLSARIADPHNKTADDFAAHMRTNPFLRELMETFLKIGGRRGKAGGPGIDFDELGLSEVVQLLDDANMEAVILDFGDKNPQEDPVIHFYEDFVKEYDKSLWKGRGVIYTPRPVVCYIVHSVDELLRTEFGLADGLADSTTWGEMTKRHKDLKIPKGVSPDQDFVQILDPATGTGTFLVEVIDLIHKTLTAKWKAQGHGEKKINTLWNDYVPRHLLTRLHGYELLMAPYAIAHLKIGLKLYETGYRFGSDERARVYLTNALESAQEFAGRFEFAIPALAHEAAAVNDVKRREHFTVVIGNPPYAGISSNMSESAQRMVDAYRVVDGAALNERKLWLQDDYVKFTRKAQATIDNTTIGLVGYITNHGYLDNPTFRGMRQSLMATFPRIRLLDLHGNANKKERSPDGSDDKNVFDIRQGVALFLASRGGGPSLVAHTDVWGSREAKYDWLAKHSAGNTDFAKILPYPPFYFFEPQNTSYREEYDSGFKLTDAMPCFGLGVQTSRDHLVVGFDSAELEGRIERFIAPNRSDAEIRSEFFPGKVVADYAAGDTRQWALSDARRKLRADSTWRKRIRPCLYRPFDWRVILYDKRMVDWPRPEVLGHMLHPNLCLLVNRQSKEDFAVLCAKAIPERKIAAVYDASSSFPLYLYPYEDGLNLSATSQANFSNSFLKTLAAKLGVEQTTPSSLPAGLTAEELLGFIYAVFHSPGYRSRYADFLKIDFPRLPLTGNLKLFRALARLGGELIALHLLESPKLNKAITEFIGGRNSEVEKVTWSKSTVWIDKAQTTGFKGVREDVWNFHIGGYQVCEKWLKDRKARRLSKDDIAHYQKIVVALAETVRLMTEIDDVIEMHGGWPGAFHTNTSAQNETGSLLKVAERDGDYRVED
jgi:predicted helicase